MAVTGRQLVRNIAHDVRTPLNAISGLSALLASEGHGPLNADQREFVSRIAVAVVRATSLLDSLLTSLDVQVGELQLRVEPTALTPLVRQLASEQIGSLVRSDRACNLELAEVGFVTTDPDLVQRVVANLLSNAMKYTEPQGTIRVAVEAVGSIASPLARESVAIRVADSGPGIPVEAQDRIFEEFVRLPGAQAEEGSGLGLAIARRISRLLGGELLLTNLPGAGPEFTFWLPRKGPTTTPSRVTSQATPSAILPPE